MVSTGRGWRLERCDGTGGGTSKVKHDENAYVSVFLISSNRLTVFFI